MMKKIVLGITVAAMIGVIPSCKKDKTPENPDPGTSTPIDSPDFTVAGALYVYQNLYFTANTKKDQQLTWYFGTIEEKTLNSNEVTYMFTEPGIYKVSMAVVDGFGGTVSKDITITNGTERLKGNQNWNFFLKKDKFGSTPGSTPPTTFSSTFALNIINDSTIEIPDIPQMPVRGPYRVKKVHVNDTEMLYKSDDGKTEVSYVFSTITGGIKITQADKDYAWYLHGIATITP